MGLLRRWVVIGGNCDEGIKGNLREDWLCSE